MLKGKTGHKPVQSLERLNCRKLNLLRCFAFTLPEQVRVFECHCIWSLCTGWWCLEAFGMIFRLVGFNGLVRFRYGFKAEAGMHVGSLFFPFMIRGWCVLGEEDWI